MNFELLASNLLNQARTLVPQWLPGGKIMGREYTCGSINGGAGGSFKVNLDTGAWAEFSGDLKGGDLISLYAATKSIGNGEAYIQLGGPQDEFSFRHPKHGEPSKTWVYHDAIAHPLMTVARYDTGTGKEFLPWRREGDKWICKAMQAPRPLYGLHLLRQRPDAPVLIVEGEKAAEAARAIAPGFVVITWPNGAKAWAKADWSPVMGRKAALWPDADKPGISAMEGIADFLVKEAPPNGIKILDVSKYTDGADAADVTMTPIEFNEWCKSTPYHTNKPEIANTTIVQVVDDESPKLSESQFVLVEKLGLMAPNKKVVNNAANVVRFLMRHEKYKGRVWWDDFYQDVFTDLDGKMRQWTDYDTNELMIFLQNNLGMSTVSALHVFNALTFHSRSDRRHVVRDWIKSLKWDGVDRIGAFFTKYMGADESSAMNAFSNNFWVMMVKRIMFPGCKADYMVVLEGEQGIGKTRAFQIIGGDWYAEVGISADSEDFERQLQGKMLIEIAELQSFSKADQTRIKQIITKTSDRYREKYGKIAIDHPRQCVLVGTTNESEWIDDPTGGRRFWPVKCGAIDVDAITEDREQLFAEALKCLNDGDEGYLLPTEDTLELQNARRKQDPWEEVLALKVATTMATRVTLAEAMRLVEVPTGNMNGQMARRIAGCLRHLGFVKKTLRNQGKLQKIWIKE